MSRNINNVSYLSYKQQQKNIHRYIFHAVFVCMKNSEKRGIGEKDH